MTGVKPSAKGRYRIIMRFCPPDNRRRDVSNLHAAMKAALDGIAEAMEVDDSTFIEHAQSMGPIYKDGRVDISVEVLS
jgi:Holliday junction resolvase RusA-like endonuclease